MNKEREINDTPSDKIDPDEVRIEKLKKIVESYYNEYQRATKCRNLHTTFKFCFDDINALSHTEHYTPKEISDALLQYFVYDDIIQFLLTNYMENL